MTCRCGRPTRDAAYFCDDCGDKLARALAEVPWLDTELEVTITGTKGVDYRRGGVRSTEHRLPVNLAASTARDTLRAVLVSWVLFCDEEGVRHQSPRVGLPSDTLAAMSRWLLWRVDGLALLDIGPEAVAEVSAAVGHARRLIDRPADRWYAGPCDCGEDLYARTQAGAVACAGCEATYDIATRREWLLATAEDRLANAATIARAVSWLGAAPLTSDRVRKWAERGRILAHGHDGRSPLYRVGDAIDLLAGDTRRAG